ncbi:MAG: NifB/NifX family molybdenum-iron cluster-binding protein [Pyrobaculum sp.]
MRILIPVDKAAGLDSPVSDEFGRAPYFLIYDGGRVEIYRNEEVVKGVRHRWEEILQLKPDVVITREIGRPAYHAFRGLGISIYLAEGNTVREVVEKFEKRQLKEFPPDLVHEPRHH